MKGLQKVEEGKGRNRHNTQRRYKKVMSSHPTRGLRGDLISTPAVMAKSHSPVSFLLCHPWSGTLIFRIKIPTPDPVLLFKSEMQEFSEALFSRGFQ